MTEFNEKFVNDLFQRYQTGIVGNQDKVYRLELSAFEVGLLHGILASVASVPEIQQMYSVPQLIEKIRRWCKQVWVSMGISEEDTEILDNLKAEIMDNGVG